MIKETEVRTTILPEDLLFIIRQLVENLGYDFYVSSTGDFEKRETVVVKHLVSRPLPGDVK